MFVVMSLKPRLNGESVKQAAVLVQDETQAKQKLSYLAAGYRLRLPSPGPHQSIFIICFFFPSMGNIGQECAFHPAMSWMKGTRQSL